MKKILILTTLIILVLGIGIKADYFSTEPIKKLSKFSSVVKPPLTKIKSEESVVIGVVEKSVPSVVTIAINKTTRTQDRYQFDSFNPFGALQFQTGEEQTIEQNIGSGFIVSEDGVIITNKHVVADTEADYKVITNDKKEYLAQKILRDPLNDLAVIKIKATDLKSLDLGDSDSLVLGQMAIAIGTPLGEFTNSITTGVVSGLGRGITAGSPLQNFVERLDNVIQTDAAISPGNSGGPLLNSSSQVIGINTAVSQQGENLGFAIPVNILKELLVNYEKSGGKITRPFLGIRYQIVDRETAVTNEIAEGAYIVAVVEGSNAAKADLRKGDIIMKINGQKLTEENDLTRLVSKKEVGDTLVLEVWREGKKLTKKIILNEFN